jgi:hypothetical protein
MQQLQALLALQQQQQQQQQQTMQQQHQNNDQSQQQMHGAQNLPVGVGLGNLAKQWGGMN